MKQYVLDACALIAFFNDEAGANKVEAILEQAANDEVKVYLASINLFEIYYNALRSTTPGQAKNLLADLYNLPLVVVEHIDMPLIQLAAYFKTKHRMSVADSFALALAKQLDALLISTDHHEFDAVEKAGDVEFFWLR